MSNELKHLLPSEAMACADGEYCPYCMEFLVGEYGHRRTCHFKPFKGETERGVCSECSAFLTEQDRFCPNCGAKVVDE